MESNRQLAVTIFVRLTKTHAIVNIVSEPSSLCLSPDTTLFSCCHREHSPLTRLLLSARTRHEWTARGGPHADTVLLFLTTCKIINRSYRMITAFGEILLHFNAQHQSSSNVGATRKGRVSLWLWKHRFVFQRGRIPKLCSNTNCYVTRRLEKFEQTLKTSRWMLLHIVPFEIWILLIIRLRDYVLRKCGDSKKNCALQTLRKNNETSLNPRIQY